MLTSMLSWYYSHPIMGRFKWLNAHFYTSYRLCVADQHECFFRMSQGVWETFLYAWTLIVKHVLSLYWSYNMYFHSTDHITLLLSSNKHMGKCGYDKLFLISLESSNIVLGSNAKTANMEGWHSHSIRLITYIITIKGWYISAIVPRTYSISFYLGASDNNLGVSP